MKTGARGTQSGMRDRKPDASQKSKSDGLTITTQNWDGSQLTLQQIDGAIMPETPNGAMIFAFQNVSPKNSTGKLTLTSGGSGPTDFTAPALALDWSIQTQNWQGNNLNVTNTSNASVPIEIAAFSPGLGPAAGPLTIGAPITLVASQPVQGPTNPNTMQITFQASQNSVFGFIGGPATNNNNAYVIGLNSSFGNTGQGTSQPAQSGYFATRSGNSYSYTFNWLSAYVLYVVYLGSATVVPGSQVLTAANPTVTLLSL